MQVTEKDVRGEKEIEREKCMLKREDGLSRMEKANWQIYWFKEKCRLSP